MVHTYFSDNDIDAGDDDLYADGMATSAGGEKNESPSGEEDEPLYGDEDNFVEEATKEEREKNCAVMSPGVILQLQEEAISSVSSVLAVSRAQAIILLLHYKWCVSNVQDNWFAEEEKVREVVGLFHKPIVDSKKNRKKHKPTCGICFDSCRRDKMHDAGCGHVFCESCWRGYIDSSVNDGPGCLKLRCPDPSCNAAVGQDMVNAFVYEESKQKYSSYLLRSYIEDSKTIKWCPGPDCGMAITFEVGSESCDVTCECTYSFCWDCNIEAHRPVSCGTVEKWILKNSDEAENVTWILAHSKPCPNCKRPIEKNQGCNHMHCSICQFDFCWVCLDSFNEHHSCNSYYKEKIEGAKTERDMARRHLAKYTHYYERWTANHRSLNKAVEDMKNMLTPARTAEICFIMCLKKKEEEDMKLIKVIKDAWLQIVECRRVLKWSYAYGYYLPEHEHAKINLFEYLQGEAESGLEKLHRIAEELQTCLDSDHPLGNFKFFVEKLEKQTTVTGSYFQNLVRAFKNDLSEVTSQGNSFVGPPKEYETRDQYMSESSDDDYYSDDDSDGYD